VLNHSTHIPGLIAMLRRLAETRGIKTLVPGRLYTVGGRAGALSVRVTVATDQGLKLLARKGSQAQEVFAVTDLAVGDMEAAIAWAL